MEENQFTVFAIDKNGNHFAEDIEADSMSDALDNFNEENQDSRALFIVQGSPIYVHL